MSGKTIIITGAGSGIGRVTARTFLRTGWRVGLIGRREDALRETAGGDKAALVLPCDVVNAAEVDAAFDRAHAAWGHLDAIFNNAGTGVYASFADTTEQELAERFGSDIASVVMEVTDDKSLDKARRKELQIEHAPHMSYAARLVKLADKISNLRDILASPPADWSTERKQAYFDWAAQVVDGLRGTHPTLEGVFKAVYARRVELGCH